MMTTSRIDLGKPQRSSRLLPVVLAAVGLLLAGCDAARSRRPVGWQPASTGDLRLEGVWRDGDGRPVFLRAVDAADGLWEMATVGTNAAGFELNRSEVFLRSENDQILASIRAVAPEPEADYTFGRLASGDGALVFHFATASAIRRLALDGAIGAEIVTNSASGQRESWSVTVTNGFDGLARILASPAGMEYLDTAHPVVLVRSKEGHN